MVSPYIYISHSRHQKFGSTVRARLFRRLLRSGGWRSFGVDRWEDAENLRPHRALRRRTDLNQAWRFWWFGTWMDYFSIQLGMSSSQLTNNIADWWFGTWMDYDFPFSWLSIQLGMSSSIIFQRGRNKPPTRWTLWAWKWSLPPSSGNFQRRTNDFLGPQLFRQADILCMGKSHEKNVDFLRQKQEDWDDFLFDSPNCHKQA